MNNQRIFNLLVLGFWFSLSLVFASDKQGSNLIGNGDFRGEIVNDLPAGWVIKSPRPSICPSFRVIEKKGERCLYITGKGNPDCAGYIGAPVEIALGKTYRFHVLFRKSKDLNPIHHLLFDLATPNASYQIVEFHRLEDDWVEGEAILSFPGEGKIKAEARIGYRLCAKEKIWIRNISFSETEPVIPRWIRVACTQGPGRLEDYGLPVFRKALDIAGKTKADLVLLPEYMSGEGVQETITGPSAQLMSEKAGQYRMYVAGTIGLYDKEADRLSNAALLFNREGKLIGRYDKIHLYGPELNQEGVTPGDHVPVFQTDFGKVGFMTCSDSWFPDVAELVALKGADILLFPNLGYDRALMHTRSLDNLINIITSTRSGQYGVWDPFGNDILARFKEGSVLPSVKNIVEVETEEKLGILIFDLNLSVPSGGGTRQDAARSKRHVGNQRYFLEDEIKQEKERWWQD
ncbi:carbon-nitrogen hydrolase family protein [Candidatus Sumerlaeota bacterium]|nr:carbon-nitrogen hydrolase family protein [Candidatus Sumerlaeota bacterium]